MQVALELLEAGLTGDDPDLAYPAQYILMFFDRDDPKLWTTLDMAAETFETGVGRIGRRWAEDACATAWRLYVRAGRRQS